MQQENNTPVMQNDAELKKSVKTGMGLVVFAVIMTVIALGACGFIIYTKVTEDKRISDAVSEKCLTPADTTQAPVENSTTPSTEAPDIVSNTPVQYTDYLYVGEWGLKIKLPEDYYVKYRYIPDTGSDTKGILELTASRKNAQQWPNYGNFDNGGAVIKVYRLDHENTEPASAPKFITKIGNYYYYEVTPQQCALIDDCAGEQAVFEALDAVFSNADNYSAI